MSGNQQTQCNTWNYFEPIIPILHNHIATGLPLVGECACLPGRSDSSVLYIGLVENMPRKLSDISSICYHFERSEKSQILFRICGGIRSKKKKA